MKEFLQLDVEEEEPVSPPTSHLVLPDTCWELVFRLLVDDNQNNLTAVSEVSRSFRRISSRLRL